ncbi:hypothetical protein ACFX1Z_018544 [Malus domestica]
MVFHVLFAKIICFRLNPTRLDLLLGQRYAEDVGLLKIRASFSYCSRSMAMIKGTTSIRKEVSAIHTAFPVLFMSFFVIDATSFAACLPRTIIWDCASLAITSSSSFLGFIRSRREIPPFRAWAPLFELNLGCLHLIP